MFALQCGPSTCIDHITTTATRRPRPPIIGLFKFVGGVLERTVSSIGQSPPGTSEQYASSSGNSSTQWMSPSSIHFLQLQPFGDEQCTGGQMDANHDHGQSPPPPPSLTRTSSSLATKLITDPNSTNHGHNNNNNRDETDRPVASRSTGSSGDEASKETWSTKSFGHYPPTKKKLQVTEKDGHFIALDNNSLKLMRQLESAGQCSQVEVEIVPLRKLPAYILQQNINILTTEQLMDCQVEEASPLDPKHHHHHCQVHQARPPCASSAHQAVDRLSSSLSPSEQRSACCSLSSPGSSINATCSCLSSPPSTIYHNHHHHQQQHQQASHGCSQSTEQHSSPSSPLSLPSSLSAQLASTFSRMLVNNKAYLSDQQMQTVRQTNTTTVMAPCLRSPIITTVSTWNGQERTWPAKSVECSHHSIGCPVHSQGRQCVDYG